MDIKRIRNWQIGGFFFAAVIGTLLHFVYEWSGYAAWVGLFAAVNESIWEHSKLLLTPVILFTVIEYFAYGKHMPCFLPVKLVSAVLGVAVIIAGYYTYTGIFGADVMAVNVALFFIGAFVAYRYAYAGLSEGGSCSRAGMLIAGLAFLALIVAIPALTLDPPRIPLFRDMQSGLYGMLPR